MPVYIGETNENFEHGKSYFIQIAPFSGKRYKPGKDSNGEWLDKIGMPENRIGIYFDDKAKTYDSAESFQKDWGDAASPSRRVNKNKVAKRR